MKYLYLSICILWLFISAHQIAASPSRMELSVGNDLFSFGVTSNFDDLRFCSEVSAGIRAFQDSRLSWKGAAYGIESAVGLQYNHVQGMQNTADGIPLHQLHSFYPFFSLGVQAYVSLD